MLAQGHEFNIVIAVFFYVGNQLVRDFIIAVPSVFAGLVFFPGAEMHLINIDGRIESAAARRHPGFVVKRYPPKGQSAEALPGRVLSKSHRGRNGLPHRPQRDRILYLYSMPGFAPCIRQENMPPCPSRAMGIPCQPLNSPINSTACAPGA